MKEGFTKQDFLDKKVAIIWQDSKSKEINDFFQECNEQNAISDGLFVYYYTRSLDNPGYYGGCRNMQSLLIKGIRNVYTIDQLIKEDEVNWREIFERDKTAIKCENEDEVNQFTNILDDLGYTWCDDTSYRKYKPYIGKAICYDVKNGTYGTEQSYINLKYTILNFKDLINKNKSKMATQTISRENLGKIYKEVCLAWKGRIDIELSKNPFSSMIEVDEIILRQAFAEANSEQTELLLQFFKEPIVKFQAKDLKIGEIMKVTNGVLQGKHLMRVYDKIVVCLESPKTCNNVDTVDIEGVKLESGTKFEITAK